ncbi:MAG: GGDEF domain-containing protein [Betaproteobacteria bacterium]
MSLRAIDDFLTTRHRLWLILTAFLLVGIVGSIDYITGFELSFAFFYLIPIAYAAWYVGLNVSLVVSLLAASVWLAVDYATGHTYSQAWMPFWNVSTRLASFVTVAFLFSALKASLNTQRQLLRVDSLTGVKSLRAFEEEANFMLDTAARHQLPISLGYIDLDGFKSLNDSMGHAVGDEVLKATGTQLNALCRRGDIVARIGGDEFVVMLPVTGKDGAETLFNKLHAHLLRTMENQGWNIGFSIGVAIFPDSSVSLKEAREHADSLMYAVKKNGRNSVLYGEFLGIDTNTQQVVPGDVPKVARS